MKRDRDTIPTGWPYNRLEELEPGQLRRVTAYDTARFIPAYQNNGQRKRDDKTFTPTISRRQRRAAQHTPRLFVNTSPRMAHATDTNREMPRLSKVEKAITHYNAYLAALQIVERESA